MIDFSFRVGPYLKRTILVENDLLKMAFLNIFNYCEVCVLSVLCLRSRYSVCRQIRFYIGVFKSPLYLDHQSLL